MAQSSLHPDDSAHSKPGAVWEWLGWVVALAAIVVAIYFGHRSTKLEQQLNQDRAEIVTLSVQAARAQALTDALTSPETTTVTLTETRQIPQPTAHVMYLPVRGALIFVADNLRRIPQGKTYELWLLPDEGKAPIPAGLFRPDASGSAAIVLPPLPKGQKARGFEVTVEEAQGSPTPTLPIMLSGK